MIEATEEMKAMARRIVNANSNYMNGLDRGQINFSAQEVLQIALAAIIETQELIAQFIERDVPIEHDGQVVGRCSGDAMTAAAIRSGKQYGKE